MSPSGNKNFWPNLLKKIAKIIAKNAGLRTRKPTHNQHVVPHKEGWAIKGEGNQKYTAVYRLQSKAIERAKDIADNYKADVIIHRKDGSIRDRLNYD